MLLDLAVLVPRREVPQLSLTMSYFIITSDSAHVIPVVGHPHLGADQEDLFVEEDDAAVVDDVLVDDGHADVDEHVFGVFALEDLDEDLPRVQVRVACAGSGSACG